MADTLERPPTRYSVNQEDFSFEVGKRLRVMLDGDEQDCVRSYDCEVGTIVRCKTDERGMMYVNEQGDAAAIETLSGNVTVEWKN